jgi:L-2-hydroxyglutarate oxidase LhgO
MEDVDAVVIGAGVVGLAVARELALSGRATLVLEAAEHFGTGSSARSSEVIHAGIYYPQGSLKARLCVAGRERLYEFSRKRGVPHRRCGKLIVATSAAHVAALEALAAAASANGVALVALEAAAAQRLEPELFCVAALYSPLSGIVDSHAYMLALLGEAEAAGATLATRSAVTRVVLQSEAALIGVNGCEPSLRARALINCGGLQAPALAQCMEGLPQAHVPRTYFAKGNYFTLSGPAPFRHLIYPLPEAGGLGIHLTLDLAGRGRFGPDVEWLESPDYEVNPARAARFDTAIRSYWPGLPNGALAPAYAGVRPRIFGPGEAAADFRIDDASVHRVPYLINLFGIESPGLTASLALASETVARLG